MTSTNAFDPRSVTLHDPGGPVPFGELAADPLVVILVRYFGCLPCQAYLQDIDAARRRFPPQAGVVAVGGSADYHARWLRDSQGIDMPLLLDSHQHIRTLAELGDLTRRQLEATVVDVSSEFSDTFSADAAIDGDLATEWSTQGGG